MKIANVKFAIDSTELPTDPDLLMVFAAKTQWYEHHRTYLLQSDIEGQTDAGAVALLQWMRDHRIDLIYS